MNLQERARALYKWGRLYPNVFPNALIQASILYKQDRINRGIENE